MSPLRHQPLTDPLLEDQNDRLALSSENALLRQTAKLNKLNHEYEAMKEDLKHVINAYHGADSRATRLDSQNTRMITQLKLVGERLDELEEKNSALEEQAIELVRRLAESERAVARLKVVGNKGEAQTVGVKCKRESFPLSFENSPDVDESASVVKEET
jgi:predicted nuclease with TOPRIM domain